MNLRNKKQLAGRILKISPKRIWADSTKSNELKEAITREDIRNLMQSGVITIKPKKWVSRSNAREIIKQRRKGRRKGKGSKKGVKTSRLPRKEEWKLRIRSLRKLLIELTEKNLVTKKTYRLLRQKAKGGFFRSQRHIKLYLTENELWTKENGKK